MTVRPWLPTREPAYVVQSHEWGWERVEWGLVSLGPTHGNSGEVGGPGLGQAKH